jgi:hypothetical protein
MAVHAVLTGLAAQSLTVAEFIADEPDLEALYASLDLAGLAILLALGSLSWMLGWRRAFRRTILVYLILSTFTLIVGCWDQVSTLTERTSDTAGAFALLWDAALTWATNVLTFAVWYWFLDRGGPDRRHGDAPEPPDLAFPQQTAAIPGWEHWTPGLIDYLFVAFNTSMAFSPTDTLILSSRAKVLSMLQAGVSLVVIAMLAARVVNTIQ